MRWFVLLVMVIIGLLFLYDKEDLRIKFGAETPTPLTSVVWPRPVVTLAPPPAERIKGVWIRVGGSERLEFRGDGRLSRRFNGHIYDYSYTFFTNDDRIQIVWTQAGVGRIPFVRDYSYEFKDNTLILTEDTDGQFIYLRDSETVELERQALKSIGSNPVMITGRLVGPAGVLAEQPVTLARYTSCSDPKQLSTCKKEEVATVLTSSDGQYKFLEVEPEDNYNLAFQFSIANPNQIPGDVLVGSFVLSKRGSEIAATSNSFYLHGFESEQMKIIDFVYPSSPPPTVTPSLVSATPGLTPTVQSISTSVPSVPTLSPTSIAATGTFTASVPGNVVWFDTGIVVQPGQNLTISASGSINTWGGIPEATNGPNGWLGSLCPSAENKPDCLMNQVLYGKLIGKIGDNEPFEVGTNLETSAAARGKLYLSVNDNAPYFFDNIGAYQVKITVNSPN